MATLNFFDTHSYLKARMICLLNCSTFSNLGLGHWGLKAQHPKPWNLRWDTRNFYFHDLFFNDESSKRIVQSHEAYIWRFCQKAWTEDIFFQNFHSMKLQGSISSIDFNGYPGNDAVLLGIFATQLCGSMVGCNTFFSRFLHGGEKIPCKIYVCLVTFSK